MYIAHEHTSRFSLFSFRKTERAQSDLKLSPNILKEKETKKQTYRTEFTSYTVCFV